MSDLAEMYFQFQSESASISKLTAFPSFLSPLLSSFSLLTGGGRGVGRLRREREKHGERQTTKIF